MPLADQNMKALAARIGAPLLGDVAHNAVLTPHTVAAQLDLSKLAKIPAEAHEYRVCDRQS